MNLTEYDILTIWSDDVADSFTKKLPEIFANKEDFRNELGAAILDAYFEGVLMGFSGVQDKKKFEEVLALLAERAAFFDKAE